MKVSHDGRIKPAKIQSSRMYAAVTRGLRRVLLWQLECLLGVMKLEGGLLHGRRGMDGP